MEKRVLLEILMLVPVAGRSFLLQRREEKCGSNLKT
jgi:hypothetical protein